jgi:hypothetical protein
MINKLFYTFLFAMFSMHGMAQNVVFRASVSNSKVALDNSFQLSFSVDNVSGIQNFAPPKLDAFYVLSGPNRSSSFSNINGSTSSKIAFSYILQPKRVGKYNIGCATAVVDGKGISSNTNTIEVVAVDNTVKRYHNKAPQHDAQEEENYNPFAALPRAPKQPSANNKNKPFTKPSPANIGKKVFAQLDVDKREAYVGEQIIANYNIYAQIPCEVDVNKINTPEGFWTQDFTDVINPQESEKVTIKGQQYRKYTLRKTALFPSKAGKLIIPPMEFSGFAQVESTNGTNSARGSIIEEILGEVFENGVVSNVPLNLKTDSVSIVAKEIPATNKPMDYNNNIGDYTLESSIDKTELSTNDAVRITFTVRGKGNIRLLNAPVVNWGNNFLAMEPTVFDTITNNKNDVEGYKTFNYTLQPTTSGTFVVPRVMFHYFDPAGNTYKTLQSPEYTLKVIAAKSGNEKESKSEIVKDLHDILNEDNMQKYVPNILVEKPAYWLGFILPLMGLLTLIWRNKKQQKAIVSGAEKANTKKYNAIAKERLAIAQQMLSTNNKNGFCTQIDQALWLYISDKLNIPLSQLNSSNAKQYMQHNKIDEALQEQFLNLTKQCQDAMYGQQADIDMQNMYAQSVDVINKIEAILA